MRTGPHCHGEFSVALRDGRGTPVVVCVGADVGPQWAGRSGVRRRLLAGEFADRCIDGRKRFGVELAPVLADLAELDEIGELRGQGFGNTGRCGIGKGDDRHVSVRDDHEIRCRAQIEGAGMAQPDPAGR